MRKLTHVWSLPLIIFLCFLVCALWLSHIMHQPGQQNSLINYKVKSGQPLRSVLSGLHKVGVIQYPRLTELWSRASGHYGQVRVGHYEIPAQSSSLDVLEQLNLGLVRLESITIIEGSRYSDLIRSLTSHVSINKTLINVSKEEVMRRLGAPGVYPEGRFFPDTYHFAPGTSDFKLLSMAYKKMQRQLDAAWVNRAKGLPLKDPTQLLALASIVEKETALATERSKVAGVYITRLRKGMYLQSDPTVIYGIGADYDGNIRRSDLQRDTPYNTYKRKGLPPTAVAMPGDDSLHAATHPDETGDIFFVANGTSDGSHYFSKTYVEHAAAVQRMILRQRSRVIQ